MSCFYLYDQCRFLHFKAIKFILCLFYCVVYGVKFDVRPLSALLKRHNISAVSTFRRIFNVILIYCPYHFCHNKSSSLNMYNEIRFLYPKILLLELCSVLYKYAGMNRIEMASYIAIGQSCCCSVDNDHWPPGKTDGARAPNLRSRELISKYLKIID